MLGIVLAVSLACVAGTPRAADDPMNSKGGVGTVFGTLAVDQPLGEGLFMPSARLSVVAQRRFGLEASVSSLLFAGTLAEASALGAIDLAGIPVLFKAGVSHVKSIDSGDRSRGSGRSGYHAGVSLLTGDAGDGVRWRFDYTYRRIGRDDGFSTVGLGLVLNVPTH